MLHFAKEGSGWAVGVEVATCIGLWGLSGHVCLSSLCVSMFKTCPDLVFFP